jgi:hypothetical protein
MGSSAPQVDEQSDARLTEAAVCLLGTTSHLSHISPGRSALQLSQRERLLSDGSADPGTQEKAARDLPDRSAYC